MSVETTELSRSKLQRKDRAQLQIIAKAMGGRPEPKARKADIVDMILDLAGIDAGGNGSAGPNGDGPAAAEGDGPADPALADDAADGAVEAPAVEAPAADENRSDQDRGDRPDRDRPDRSRPDGDRSGRSRQDRDRSDRDRPDRSRQDGDRQDRDRPDRSRQRPDGDRPDRSRQQDDQPEMGNRRRRRRGRNDRERPDEPWEGDPIAISGHLDLRDDGYGFLRIKGFQPSKDDAYVSVKQVRQFGLRKGDLLTGGCRPATRNEKNPALLHIDSVNGLAPESAKQRPKFEDLTPLFPRPEAPAGAR